MKETGKLGCENRKCELAGWMVIAVIQEARRKGISSHILSLVYSAIVLQAYLRSYFLESFERLKMTIMRVTIILDFNC